MLSSIGDLTSLTFSARRSAELKTQIADLTQELSSGRVVDPADHLAGDLGFLADVESRSTALTAYETAAAEAGLVGDAMQASVGHLLEISNKLTRQFESTAGAGFDLVRGQIVATARSDLDLIVTTLNGTVAGRSMFSGIASDAEPLAGADVLIAALSAELTGATDVADVQARADAWFSDPAGFDAVMYQGSTTPRSAVPIAEGDSVSFDILANDPAFKEVLKQTALGALADDPGLTLNNVERLDLVGAAGVGFLTAIGQLANLGGEVGTIQARVEAAGARNSSARAALEIARTDLIGADPFDSAVRLEAAQTQLDTLFAVTARSARISLTNYL